MGMKQFDPIPEKTEKTAKQIIDSAFKVHDSLGPGLLESIYETCLTYELEKRGLKIKRRVVLPIVYDDIKLDAGLRLDLIVEDCVVIELKAVEKMLPVFESQRLTYLKLSNKRLGLLINFNVSKIKDGIKRMVL